MSNEQVFKTEERAGGVTAGMASEAGVAGAVASATTKVDGATPAVPNLGKVPTAAARGRAVHVPRPQASCREARDYRALAGHRPQQHRL